MDYESAIVSISKIRGLLASLFSVRDERTLDDFTRLGDTPFAVGAVSRGVHNVLVDRPGYLNLVRGFGILGACPVIFLSSVRIQSVSPVGGMVQLNHIFMVYATSLRTIPPGTYRGTSLP